MTGTIILQGITLEDFRNMLREEIKAELKSNDSEKVRVLSKVEACRMLKNCHYNTLKNLAIEFEVTQWTTAHIEAVKLKYPKYRT